MTPPPNQGSDQVQKVAEASRLRSLEELRRDAAATVHSLDEPDPDQIQKVAEASRLRSQEALRRDAAATVHSLDEPAPDQVQTVAEASRLRSLEALRRDAATPFQFFSQDAETTKAEGAYLPHWHQDGVIYFVTFRLADSLPQDKLNTFSEEKECWLEQNPEPHTPEQKADFHKRFPQRLQQWLDLGYGSMILRTREARQLVQNAITHFNGDRYQLDEFVVAANHVHVLLAPRGDHTLSAILHSWKSFTAKKILTLPAANALTTAPTVWQKESWDHIVRSEASLNRFREYIRSH